jgi:asparagine synthetase A
VTIADIMMFRADIMLLRNRLEYYESSDTARRDPDPLAGQRREYINAIEVRSLDVLDLGARLKTGKSHDIDRRARHQCTSNSTDIQQDA